MNHGRGVTSQPSVKEHQNLPEDLWVSLAEALTWIAFGDAMTQKDLRKQVEGSRPPVTDSPEEQLRKFFAGKNDDVHEIPGLGYFRERQVGLDRLALAWRELRDAVDLGAVAARGRSTATFSEADARLADVARLTGRLLATFSQFDISAGGIRRQPENSPDVIWQDHPQSFDREVDSLGDDGRKADGFLMVVIERAGLLATFSSISAARAPSVKGGYPPDDVVILAKADEMKVRGLTGYQIASSMRHEHGFENVGTTSVRDLIKGRWKPGGRPKQKGA